MVLRACRITRVHYFCVVLPDIPLIVAWVSSKLRKVVAQETEKRLKLESNLEELAKLLG